MFSVIALRLNKLKIFFEHNEHENERQKMNEYVTGSE